MPDRAILKRPAIELSDELIQCLNKARREVPFGRFIENTLWESEEVKNAAFKLGLQKPKRAGVGRPKGAGIKQARQPIKVARRRRRSRKRL